MSKLRKLVCIFQDHYIYKEVDSKGAKLTICCHGDLGPDGDMVQLNGRPAYAPELFSYITALGVTNVYYIDLRACQSGELDINSLAASLSAMVDDTFVEGHIGNVPENLPPEVAWAFYSEDPDSFGDFLNALTNERSFTQEAHSSLVFKNGQVVDKFVRAESSHPDIAESVGGDSLYRQMTAPPLLDQHSGSPLLFSGVRPIRLGDSTSHGGKVTSAQSRLVIYGQPVATIGDNVMCPQCGPGIIAQGDVRWTVDGKPVALNDHMTSCGATLISSLPP